MLKFYSASNGIINSANAMSEALNTALSSEGHLDCDLIVVHCTMGHDIAELVGEAKKLSPKATVVGCTCGGVIGREGANESMRALGIMAIKGDPGEFAVSIRGGLSEMDSFKCAKELSEDLKNSNSQVNMVMILASGIDVVADHAIAGIESVFGEVPIFGGTSFDNMKAISNIQFVDEKMVERGMLLIGFADPTLKVHMRAHHGNAPLGLPFRVTKASGNRVDEIENQAAWPYLMEALGLPLNTHPSSTIPFAGLGEDLSEVEQEQYDSRQLMRAVVKLGPNGSFYFPTLCPEGTELWLTRRDERTIFDGMGRMLTRLCDDIQGQELVAVFHTDCAARGKVMFNQAVKDQFVGEMQNPFFSFCASPESKVVESHPIPWLGMYGLGEFTQFMGKNRFHNYTTSVYALTRDV